MLVAETCLANVTGAPALSLPLASAGFPPVSLQILAPRNRDDRLFEVAHAIETAIGD